VSNCANQKCYFQNSLTLFIPISIPDPFSLPLQLFENSQSGWMYDFSVNLPQKIFHHWSSLVSNILHTVLCVVENVFELKTEDDMTSRPRDDKPRPYLCTVSDKRFTQKRHSNEHREIHSAARLYSYRKCKKCFLTKNCVHQHTHIHRRKYRCTECGKCYRDGHDLARHKRSHSSEKTFECPVCSKRFSSSSYLVMHGRIHRGEKLYKCQLCNKTFSQPGYLKAHMGVHTEDKPHMCSLCNKCFRQSSGLRQHKHCVHSDKRPHQCPHCEVKCKTNSDLQRHVNVHTVTKPHSCSHCSASFIRPAHLKTHLLRSHNEGAWLTCDICQKKFSNPDSLRYHTQRCKAVGLQWMYSVLLHNSSTEIISNSLLRLQKMLLWFLQCTFQTQKQF